jgi:hypothetical protein
MVTVFVNLVRRFVVISVRTREDLNVGVYGRVWKCLNLCVQDFELLWSVIFNTIVSNFCDWCQQIEMNETTWRTSWLPQLLHKCTVLYYCAARISPPISSSSTVAFKFLVRITFHPSLWNEIPFSYLLYFLLSKKFSF